MLLLLMRHGIAEPLAEPDADDAARPLSAKGHKRTAQVAQGLATLVPRLDVLASSPKLRARQTAMLAHAALAHPPRLEWDELLLETDFAPLLKRLSKSGAETVLLVGHEPNLSRLVAWLLTGDEAGMALDFKKAGVCALEFKWQDKKPRATLLWLLPPRTLRRLRP